MHSNCFWHLQRFVEGHQVPVLHRTLQLIVSISIVFLPKLDQNLLETIIAGCWQEFITHEGLSLRIPSCT